MLDHPLYLHLLPDDPGGGGGRYGDAAILHQRGGGNHGGGHCDAGNRYGVSPVCRLLRNHREGESESVQSPYTAHSHHAGLRHYNSPEDCGGRHHKHLHGGGGCDGGRGDKHLCGVGGRDDKHLRTMSWL